MTLRTLTTVGGLYAMLLLSGCSIVMALHGNTEPDFEQIKVGATKDEIEFVFNQPGTVKELGEGKTEITYTYEIGNSPNPGRAAVNGYVDLYTIGLAEPILTIIELIQGDDVETQVVYGPDQRVLEIRGYIPPPPSAELKAAQEEQEKYVKSVRPRERINPLALQRPLHHKEQLRLAWLARKTPECSTGRRCRDLGDCTPA